MNPTNSLWISILARFRRSDQLGLIVFLLIQYRISTAPNYRYENAAKREVRQPPAAGQFLTDAQFQRLRGSWNRRRWRRWRRSTSRSKLVLHGGNSGSGIGAAQDAAVHAELQWTRSVQQVRPFQRDLDDFALYESVVALEEQTGTSHIGEFSAAVFPGFQYVCQLQSEGKTALFPPVISRDRRRGSPTRDFSPA
jgi:hypothetical protein